MKRGTLALSVVAMASLAAGAAHAGAYDLVTDFPDHQGANGFYAYGYDGTTYRSLDEHPAATYAFVGRDASLWYVPYVSRDYIGDNVNTPDYVAMHPSQWTWVVSHDSDGLPPPENAILAWKAGSDGFASLAGEFRKPSYLSCGVTVCDGVHVYVRKNGTVLWETDLTTRAGSAVSFDLASVPVKAGDMILFGVAARGNDQWDETFLKGRITTEPVPEAETWAMLLVGLGAFASRRVGRHGKSRVA